MISSALFKSRPQCPDDAEPNILVGHVEAVLSSRYALAREAVSGNRPLPFPPMGWRPDATLPLEESLPYPWAPTQEIDTDLLWPNAIALRRAWERGGRTKARGAIEEIAQQLITRMHAHTVRDGAADFLVQQQADVDNPICPPAPWVSAVANAQALLACLQLHPLFGTSEDSAAYGAAFRQIHQADSPPPARWISLRDSRGYLWFDEFPQPGGQSSRVMTGHIFALLALHELALEDQAYLPFVQAGITTVEAYANCFRRSGQSNRHALDFKQVENDTPDLAMNAYYQMYELSAAPVFLMEGDAVAKNFASQLDGPLRQAVQATRGAAVAAVARRDYKD